MGQYTGMSDALVRVRKREMRVALVAWSQNLNSARSERQTRDREFSRCEGRADKEGGDEPGSLLMNGLNSSSPNSFLGAAPLTPNMPRTLEPRPRLRSDESVWGAPPSPPSSMSCSWMSCSNDLH